MNLRFWSVYIPKLEIYSNWNKFLGKIHNDHNVSKPQKCTSTKLFWSKSCIVYTPKGDLEDALRCFQILPQDN